MDTLKKIGGIGLDLAKKHKFASKFLKGRNNKVLKYLGDTAEALGYGRKGGSILGGILGRISSLPAGFLMGATAGTQQAIKGLGRRGGAQQMKRLSVFRKALGKSGGNYFKQMGSRGIPFYNMALRGYGRQAGSIVNKLKDLGKLALEEAKKGKHVSKFLKGKSNKVLSSLGTIAEKLGYGRRAGSMLAKMLAVGNKYKVDPSEKFATSGAGRAGGRSFIDNERMIGQVSGLGGHRGGSYGDPSFDYLNPLWGRSNAPKERPYKRVEYEY